MKYELVCWETKGSDDNNGFVWGVHYLDEYDEVLGVEWFKTKQERENELQKYKEITTNERNDCSSFSI